MSGDPRAASRPEQQNDDDAGPVEAASALADAGIRYFRRIVELAATEAQLAAISGVSMLLLGIVASAFVIIAWALLASVVGYLLVRIGLPWPAAGLLLAAAHAGAAYALWRAIVRLSRALTLPALRSAVFEED